tara:strand:- start:9 stop:671 length:663 start_codon:yes stop_codon:yes gene_type:complete
MMKKIKALAFSAILAFSSTSIAHAVSLDSFAIGVTGSYGAFEATGTETVNGAKQTDTGELEVTFGSIFAEVDAGPIVIGIDVIPAEVESAAVNSERVEDVGSSSSTVSNSAFVNIADHITGYVVLPIADTGLFIRAGYSSMDVQTKENLGTGGTYPDVDIEGYHAGVGLEIDVDSNVFIRAALNYHDYEEVKVTNQQNSDITIEADLDGYSGSFSIARRF